MSKINWKKILKIILIVLIVIIVIIFSLIALGFGYVKYVNWYKDKQETMASGETALFVPQKVEEPCVTCLFLGTNGSLTDFIMLGQYNPNNREIALLSIPRDSYVGKESTDGKINSASSSKGIESLKNTIYEITGIKVDYYISFKAKILRDLVNKIGGVTVDVPMDMNYDDPYQDLYIHLKKGTQKLTGSQAEQLVRFRKGYAQQDLDRIKTQQLFVKAFISEILKAEDLINIVLDGTKTDITLDVAMNYIDDVAALKLDRIKMNTAPGKDGSGKNNYGQYVSFFFIDEDATKTLVDEMFRGIVVNESGDSGDRIITSGDENVISTHEAVRVELMNAGADSTAISNIVKTLKDNNFYVVKIGNSDEKENESKIINYEKEQNNVLTDLKNIIKGAKVEKSEEESSVSYTIIIGKDFK